MTRLAMSVVDCCGGDQCAETPIAPNEIAAIQTDVRFIGVLTRSATRIAGAGDLCSEARAPHETTGALQWEQMFVRKDADESAD